MLLQDVADHEKSIIELYGEVAYAQQSPWIENKTIRDNILFGQPLDKKI